MPPVSRRLFPLTLTLLGAATIVACSKPEPPQLTPHKLTVKKVGPEGVELVAEIDARNPNGVSLTVDRVRGDLKVDTRKIGTFDVPRTVTLPANGTTRVNATVTAGWAEVSAAVKRHPGDTVPITLDGTVTIGGPLSLDLPITMQGEVKKADVVKAGIKGLDTFLKGL